MEEASAAEAVARRIIIKGHPMSTGSRQIPTRVDRDEQEENLQVMQGQRCPLLPSVAVACSQALIIAMVGRRVLL